MRWIWQMPRRCDRFISLSLSARSSTGYDSRGRRVSATGMCPTQKGEVNADLLECFAAFGSRSD